MGTKYTTNAVSGYNSSPPADDGTTSASNQVKWSTIKTKVTDPLNTAIAAIDAGLVAAFDYSARSITTGDTTVAGDHMRTIEIAPTVSSVVTVNLGDAATMAAGYVVNIVNRSNYNAVIGRATSTNFINGAAADDTLSALTSVTYKVNSTANGFVSVAKATAGSSQNQILIQDQQTNTTAGHAYTAGGWRTVTLNTTVTDTGSDVVSLSSNQFALKAGSYEISARVNAGLFAGGFASCRAKLRNITDSTNTLFGVQTNGAAAVEAVPTVEGSFTITAQKTFEIQVYPGGNSSAAAALSSGEVEVYASVKLRRIL